MQLASGTILPAKAAARLCMRLAGKTCRQRFTYMSGLTVPVMLGSDFIVHVETVLNLVNKDVYLVSWDTFFSFSRLPYAECPHPVHVATECHSSENVKKAFEKCSGTDAQKQPLGSVLEPYSSTFTERPRKTSMLIQRADT